MLFACEKKEKTSQYKGVSWNKQIGKWYVQLWRVSNSGAYFKNELDAAKRVNQLCEELGIPLRNPDISVVPNQQYQVTKQFVRLMCLQDNQNYENYFFNFFQIFFFLIHKLCFKLNIFSFPSTKKGIISRSKKSTICTFKILHQIVWTFGL